MKTPWRSLKNQIFFVLKFILKSSVLFSWHFSKLKFWMIFIKFSVLFCYKNVIFAKIFANSNIKKTAFELLWVGFSNKILNDFIIGPSPILPHAIPSLDKLWARENAVELTVNLFSSFQMIANYQVHKKEDIFIENKLLYYLFFISHLIARTKIWTLNLLILVDFNTNDL